LEDQLIINVVVGNLGQKDY
jgi:hypothetical protein